MPPSMSRLRALVVLIVLLAAGVGFSLLRPEPPVAELHMSGLMKTTVIRTLFDLSVQQENILLHAFGG